VCAHMSYYGAFFLFRLVGNVSNFVDFVGFCAQL
jgi:ribosome-associated toxin RatA of RatAB toxin-antitoxin module